MNFDHKEFAPRIVLQSIPIWKEYWIPLATAAFLLITSQPYYEFNKIFDFPIVYQLHDLHSLHNPKKYEMRNWLKRNQIGFSIMRWSMDDFYAFMINAFAVAYATRWSSMSFFIRMWNTVNVYDVLRSILRLNSIAMHSILSDSTWRYRFHWLRFERPTKESTSKHQYNEIIYLACRFWMHFSRNAELLMKSILLICVDNEKSNYLAFVDNHAKGEKIMLSWQSNAYMQNCIALFSSLMGNKWLKLMQRHVWFMLSSN